jgi:hypothetical protein
MSREIKFRAWESRGNESKMIYSTDKTYENSILLLNFNGDILCAKKLHKGEKNHTTDEAYNHSILPARIGHNLELMQYIGKKDRTAKRFTRGILSRA